MEEIDENSINSNRSLPESPARSKRFDIVRNSHGEAKTKELLLTTKN